MAKKQTTGSEREKPFLIGKGKPPKEHQFVKGNKAAIGRKTPITLTDKLRKVLLEPDDEFATKADKLIDMAVKSANSGDYRFFKEIFERIDGKVPDRLANSDGNELLIRVLRQPFKPANADD